MNNPTVNVGDEFVVRIAGYPVAMVVINGISFSGDYIARLYNNNGEFIYDFRLPSDFTPVDEIDGVDHTRKLSVDSNE
mgnify:CR=1 FL=1